MSPATAGQALSPDRGDLTPVEEALRSLPRPGITVGRWTVRWAVDCWSVGRWVNGNSRPRWRAATWHNRLDTALVRLLDQLVGDRFDGVSDLEQATALVQETYEGIVRGIHGTLVGE